MLLLICDHVISSHAEVDIYNPFRKYSAAYQDLLADRSFIFLQHGITVGDLSGWLGKHSKNLAGFITAAKPEYHSIITGRYGYAEENIWATGFPRFDQLYDDKQRLIVVMPTWRKYLMRSYNYQTGRWSLAPNFKDSDFFRFYNGLINSPKLLELLKAHNYQLAFLPHPNLQPHLSFFDHNPAVKFMGTETEYREIYAKASLILTDYSSAAFDFAYLHKPILYAHFDVEDFFSGGHTYNKGYFDHKCDGFGEVEYDLESTIDRIIEYMEKRLPVERQIS